MPLHKGGVRQDQIGIGHHFRGIGVGIDDPRDHIFPVLLIGQHLHHRGGVHRRIPRHIRHVKEQGVDPVGVAGMGIGDQHMHQAMGGERIFPGKRLVDPRRGAILLQRQLLWSAHIAQMRPRQGLARCGNEMRRRMRFHRFRIGRLHPEPARHIDRSQHDLQQMQGAGGLKAVGMRRDSPHGVERHRPPGHRGMGVAAKIHPFLRQINGLIERHIRQFRRQCPDPLRRNPAALCHRFRRMFRAKVAFRHMLKHRPVALPDRPQIRLHPLAIPGRGCPGAAVYHERLAFGVLHDQPLFRALLGHQQRRIGKLRQIFKVNLAGLHQAMHQAEDHEAIGARRDRIPVVGHGAVTGADRVDRDHPRPAPFQLAKADLDRVAVVIFRHAEHHEQLGALPIRGPKLPERPADGINAARRHVDRTKSAMRGIIRCAKGLRPPAGETLALIAPGEEGELLRCGLAQRLQPGYRRFQRLLPGDFLERARAPRPHPPQRSPQPRRRGDLHDAAGPLGAQHALVDRMVAVALDITDAALAQMHIDPAAAGAHVAGGLADLV